MAQIKTPLDVYKLLPKTNCRECRLPSCMAFSAAVLRGEKEITDCPYVDRTVLGDTKNIERLVSISDRREEAVALLRSRIPSIDLAASAERLGGRIEDGRLALRSLGRDFFIDAEGNVSSSCHTHSWVTLFLLDYIINSTGEDPVGRWTPFRELKKGAERAALFGRMCEKPLKEMADTHTDLFGDIIDIFSGDRTKNMFSSDISLILYPLPRVPILICYWKPDGDMESSLHIFFDATAETHLAIQSIYDIGLGLAMMLDKVLIKHKGD